MKKIIITAIYTSFIMLISSCATVNSDLFPDKPIDPNYEKAHGLILAYLDENYKEPKPVNDNDMLHVWLADSRKDNSANKFNQYFELIQNCDCNRIVTRYIYAKNKNRMKVTFIESSKIFHSNEGKNKIKQEMNAIKSLLNEHNLSDVTIGFDDYTLKL